MTRISFGNAMVQPNRRAERARCGHRWRRKTGARLSRTLNDGLAGKRHQTLGCIYLDNMQHSKPVQLVCSGMTQSIEPMLNSI